MNNRINSESYYELKGMFIILIICSIIGYYFWLPILIIFFLIATGYTSIKIGEISFSIKFYTALLISIFCSIFYAFGMYFLNYWFKSPLWYLYTTYFLGLINAVYITYDVTHFIRTTPLKVFSKYLGITELISIITYILIIVFVSTR